MGIFFIKRDFIRLLSFLIVAGCFFFLGSVAMADCTEKFSWLPNKTKIKEYKIYYGQTDGGPYPNPVVVSKDAIVEGRVRAEITGLTCEERYYFVLVVVNDASVEGPYSSQLSVTVGKGSTIPVQPDTWWDFNEKEE